ncbi:MAG: DUF4159 domain-containing protein [Alphaproteobacteria bacterium]|nr:DUF4159 domain-containing protein [Alphaproteobacteria bacterium]
MPGLPLAFTAPWLLAALIALPLLWWLLRVMPPRPRRIAFPPTNLLRDLAPRDDTASTTPWWLTALRLAAATCVIFAAAGPVWNPHPEPGGRFTLVILLDDGWSAASRWDVLIRTADELIAGADSDRRAVAVVPLSQSNHAIGVMPAGAARVALRQLRPQPHIVPRVDTLVPLARLLKTAGDCEIVFLSDGVDDGHGEEFLRGLSESAGPRPLTVYEGLLPPPLALVGAENEAAGMTVTLRRVSTGEARGTLRALDRKGATIAQAAFAFAPDDRETRASFALPVELRNDIARLEIAGERSAGAVQLLDRRWQRRSVGIVSGSAIETAQPLLAPGFYLSRAIAPFADVRLATQGAPQQGIADFLEQNLPMIILADVGAIAPDIRERLSRWINNGGILLRFAGPRLAQADDDSFLPVKLRRGDRSLGGSLTWERPQHLSSFSTDGPFAGLTVSPDITVSRQVLAEPDAGLTARSWASLEDGTPLVTGEHRGKGLVGLFHVSADMRWSDLPISGTFVEMLKRIIEMSTQGRSGDSDGSRAPETLAPLLSLDGFGVAGPPPPNARALTTATRASADHPPGFYGSADSPRALNTLTLSDRLTALDSAHLNARHSSYAQTAPRDFRGFLLAAALALFLIDALIITVLTGTFPGLRHLAGLRRSGIAPLLATALLAGATLAAMRTPLHAEAVEPFAMRAVSQTRLAYVITGNAEVDDVVKAGMAGLTLFMAQRTSLEAGDPVGVDLLHDELAFFPLIYWPIVAGAPKPPQAALDRVDAYMKQGGTVIFDTRDAIEARGDDGALQTPAMQTLRSILSSLDVPEIEPVPREHVLTKTFYLLHDFPGRFDSGQTWVEALPRDSDEEDSATRPARGGDGVSPIIITSNDLAGAWALRPDGEPMLPLTPDDPRQRDFAFRGGVNIVMYTLTGNYKADQVHAPALIERLGQ